MDETAVAVTTGVAQVFDLDALKAFASDKRVRKMLFKTDQRWSEIACYEPGRSTVMHGAMRDHVPQDQSQGAPSGRGHGRGVAGGTHGQRRAL